MVIITIEDGSSFRGFMDNNTQRFLDSLSKFTGSHIHIFHKIFRSLGAHTTGKHASIKGCVIGIFLSNADTMLSEVGTW